MDWSSLSINPNIYFGLEELLKDLSGRGEFNVVYLSSSVIFSPSSIYSLAPSSGYWEEEEEQEEGDSVGGPPKKFSSKDLEFGFSYRNFLTKEVSTDDNGLFYGNLLIKTADVARLCKSWERVGLAYSEGVSAVREVLEDLEDKGRKWLAFFKTEGSTTELPSRDIYFWDYFVNDLREAVKRGLKKVDKKVVLEEIKSSVKRVDSVLGLEIRNLLVGSNDKKPYPGTLVDFNQLSSLNYVEGVPELTEEYIGKVTSFHNSISEGSRRLPEVLSFIDFLGKLNKKEVLKRGPSFYRNRENLGHLGHKEIYEKSGIELLYPETYTILLPGDSPSTIALSLKRVLGGIDSSSPAEVGIVFVGFEDFIYDDFLDTCEEKGFYNLYSVLVPYIATRQKLAISATPFLSRLTDTHGNPVGEPMGYSVDEPYEVSIHLFEKEGGNKEGPLFQALLFSNGGLLATDYKIGYSKLPDSFLVSLSPILEVMVPSRDKVHYVRNQYFDLRALANLYRLLDPSRHSWVKEKVKEMVKEDFPVSLEKIKKALESAEWDVESLEHKKRLMLIEESLRKTLESIKWLVEYPMYRLRGDGWSTKWPSPLRLCFKAREGENGLEIDLGKLSRYEALSAPLSFLLSKIFYIHGIRFSDKDKVRPADVSKRLADLAFEEDAKKVLGEVYEVLQSLGGNSQEGQEEEDYTEVVSERIESLKRVFSSGDRQRPQGPKCTLFVEYQPTLFRKAPDHMKQGEEPSEDALVLLMTSLYLAVDLEENLGVVFGLFPIEPI